MMKIKNEIGKYVEQRKGLLLFAIVLLNFVVKGFYLGSNSLAGDEPFSVFHAQMEVSDIITQLSQGNNPPFYEIILHYWIKIFGISEFSVRFPSLVFSCLTVVFLYKIGTAITSSRVGLIVAIFFIFSNYHIGFAHEARAYAMLGFLTSLSMFLYITFIKYPSNRTRYLRTNFVGIILVNTLIIYTHYFGFWVLFIQVGFLFINPSLISRYWKWMLIAILITFLLYLPNILVLVQRFSESSNGTWVPAPNGLVSIYNMLWLFCNVPVVTVFSITIIMASIVRFLIQRPPIDHAKFFIGFWFSLVFFGMFLASYKAPMFMDRYLMVAAISFPIVLALCFDFLFVKIKFGWLIIFFLTGLFVATSKPNLSNKRNVKEAVAQLALLHSNESMVYICPDWFDINFAYYFDREMFRKVGKKHVKHFLYESLHKKFIYPISHIDEVNLQLKSSIKQLIYLEDGADFHYPNNKIKQIFDRKFPLKSTYHFRETINIYVYEVNK